MNRETLIKIVAQKTGKKRDDVRDIALALESAITDALVEGDTVKLHGFGIAQVKTTNARMSQNPRTQEPVKVESKRLPVFKFSPVVAEALEAKDGGQKD